jgi:hypothetical protein
VTGVLAACVPLLATAWVYAPIRNSFFLWDDFSNFVVVADAGPLRFIVTPMAGHVLLARNALLALWWVLFGLDAGPYFWTVLLMHLLNVWLLSRLVLRLTHRAAVAAVVATLWGISPLHTEPLAWYAVFGQVLTATVMLAVTADAARCLDPPRQVSSRRALAWGCFLLLGATCFGTGLGIAATVPLAILLLVPGARRPRVAAVLLGTIAALALLYAGSQWHQATLASAITGATNLAAAPRMLLHLVRHGLARLVAGPFIVGRVDPGLGSWAVLAVTAAFGIAAVVRRGAAVRSAALGLLAIVLGTYGVIALGRANWADINHGVEAAALTLRYHYAGSAALAALLGVLLAAVTTRRGRVVDGLCAAWIVLVLVRCWLVPLPVDTHDVVRRMVSAAIARTDARLAGASPQAPVTLDNTRLPPLVTGLFGPTMIPGVAALMVLTHPPAGLEERGVRFAEPSAAVRDAFAAPRSRRLSRLLVAPAVVPGGLPPTGTSPPCEYAVVRTLLRYQRQLIRCELDPAAGGGAPDQCRTAAAEDALFHLTQSRNGRFCRTCYRPSVQVARLRSAYRNGGWMLRCDSNDPAAGRALATPAAARCRTRSGRAFVHFLLDLTRCHLRAAERTHTLDDPPCIEAAEQRYVERMRELGEACAACQPALLAPTAKRVTRELLESVFCTF